MRTPLTSLRSRFSKHAGQLGQQLARDCHLEEPMRQNDGGEQAEEEVEEAEGVEGCGAQLVTGGADA